MNKKLFLLTSMTIVLTACASTQKDWQGSGHLRIHQNGAAATNPRNFVDVNWQGFSDKILTDNHKRLGIEASHVHDGSLRIVLPSRLIQKNHSISNKATPLLKTIAEKMTENPALRAKIVGHMTNHKQDTLNQTDSLHFAYHTAERLIKQGVFSSRIEVEGRGSIDPLVSLESPRSKDINRRVEIYLYQLR